MWFGSFLLVRRPHTNLNNTDQRCTMRKEYDFTKARKNPYAAQLKKQITIRLDEDSIGYFKGISEQVGIPYQSLINLYLRDCAMHNRKLDLRWKWLVNELSLNSIWVFDLIWARLDNVKSILSPKQPSCVMRVHGSNFCFDDFNYQGGLLPSEQTFINLVCTVPSFETSYFLGWGSNSSCIQCWTSVLIGWTKSPPLLRMM